MQEPVGQGPPYAAGSTKAALPRGNLVLLRTVVGLHTNRKWPVASVPGAQVPRTGGAGSFETLAALAPQDEVGSFCHPPIYLVLRSAPKGRVSKDPQRRAR